jgi:hypothetical protein
VDICHEGPCLGLQLRFFTWDCLQAHKHNTSPDADRVDRITRDKSVQRPQGVGLGAEPAARVSPRSRGKPGRRSRPPRPNDRHRRRPRSQRCRVSWTCCGRRCSTGHRPDPCASVEAQVARTVLELAAGRRPTSGSSLEDEFTCNRRRAGCRGGFSAAADPDRSGPGGGGGDAGSSCHSQCDSPAALGCVRLFQRVLSGPAGTRDGGRYAPRSVDTSRRKRPCRPDSIPCGFEEATFVAGLARCHKRKNLRRGYRSHPASGFRGRY